MAFTPKTWLQRVVENPGRRLLTATGTTNVWDITRNEGVVVQDGDAFSVANMNDLETRIDSAFANIQDELGWIDITSLGTWSTSLLSSLTYYARVNPKIRMVEVSCILNPGRANDGVIFNLPSAYRPAITANMALSVNCYDNVKGMQINYLVDSSGNVKGSHSINTPTGIYEYICFNFTY